MISSVPVRYDKGDYAADLKTSPAKGRFAGVITYDPDTLTYEAWRYTALKPMLLGTATTAAEVLALFYRRERIAHSPGWLARRINAGVPELVDSVRWCGGWQDCDCHDDGVIEHDGRSRAHRYRWEWSQPGRRLARS